MPIYERHSKRLNATVYDVVIAQGRKRIWHRGIRSRAEAKRLETKLEAERDQGVNIAQSRLTVEQYLEGWLKSYAAGLPGKQTAATYSSNLKTHIIPFLGKKRLRDLKPKDVQDRYGVIIETRSNKTCLNVHRVLSQALAQAVKLEIINRNVCANVTPPTPVPYLVKARTVEALEKLLAAADATQYGTVARLCMWTALRQGELLNLRWSDLDLDAGLLYVGGAAKHGSAGTIVLSDECVGLLRAHGVAEELKFKPFGPSFARPEFVFTNSIGKQMDAGGLKRAWNKPKTGIRAKSGVDMRFHDLRHAHASLLIRGGVHAKVVQERLRHKQISTTMDIYGHLMPGLQADAAQKLSDAMRRE